MGPPADRAPASAPAVAAGPTGNRPADRSPTLVIHPGALGDVLLAVPALRAVRRGWPAHPLHLAAQPAIGELAVALGIVDARVDLDRLGLATLFVDDGEPPRAPAIETAAHVISWLGARDPVFVARLRRLAPTAVVASTRPPPGLTVWEHLLASTGTGAAADREPLAVPADLVAAGGRALRQAGWDGARPLLVVHAGAGGLGKRWPVDAFARVLQVVAGPGSAVVVALNEGPADGEAVQALRSRLAGPPLVIRGLALPVLAGALRHVGVWLGNDSGVSHLAAALGVPAVLLFAPDNLAWAPWSPAGAVLTIDPAAVSPADVERVVAAVRARLP